MPTQCHDLWNKNDWNVKMTKCIACFETLIFDNLDNYRRIENNSIDP